MWIRLLKDYDYRLPQATVAYKAGRTYNAPRAAASAAVNAGAAVRIPTPKKDEPHGEETN